MASRRKAQPRPVKRPENLSVLFVCTHNAGRSQMAEAFVRDLSQGRVRAASAGTDPAAAINPKTLQVMGELGIVLQAQYPKLLSQPLVSRSDIVVIMGTDVAISESWGNIWTEIWDVPNPKGVPVDGLRVIREQIRKKVVNLLNRMLVLERKNAWFEIRAVEAGRAA